jgi:hypothetical protein
LESKELRLLLALPSGRMKDMVSLKMLKNKAGHGGSFEHQTTSNTIKSTIK